MGVLPFDKDKKEQGGILLPGYVVGANGAADGRACIGNSIWSLCIFVLPALAVSCNEEGSSGMKIGTWISEGAGVVV